jgi:hypothetical protein
VCSKDSGGFDLREFLPDKKWIIEMDDFDIDKINHCIQQALELSRSQIGQRSYCNKAKISLTWEAYGERYYNNIMALYSQKHNKV